MPTNQEWLHQLAAESPDELKAWFDAEHNNGAEVDKLNERIRQLEQVIHFNKEDAEQAFRDCKMLQQQVDRLTAERDSLATDLNEMMMSIDRLSDRFREASSAALDNAHEIQRIIDNFWTI